MIREAGRPYPTTPRGEDGLTERQRALWRYMLAHQARTGGPPTRAEMGVEMGATAGGVGVHLRSLVRRGLVLEVGDKGSHCRYRAVDPSAPAGPGDLEWLLSRAEMGRIERAVREWLGREARAATPALGPLAASRAGRALAGIVDEWLAGRDAGKEGAK